jgi:hypothetical protein
MCLKRSVNVKHDEGYYTIRLVLDGKLVEEITTKDILVMGDITSKWLLNQEIFLPYHIGN